MYRHTEVDNVGVAPQQGGVSSYAKSVSERALWNYFKEVKSAVDAANQGRGNHPYMAGTFLVVALADDIEFTISGVTEEDAVLIASELRDLGVRALIRATTICSVCGERVPQQAHCVKCRAKLP